MINIKLIPELDQTSMRDGVLHIGAATTHRTLEQSPLVRAHFPTLAAVEANVANVRVREVGTLGGNLCFAEPHADPGTLLQVYDATVQLDRDGGSRQLPVEDFFVDSFEVGLEADELLTSIQVPDLAPHTAVVYRKFGFLERPSVGVAVAVTATAEQVHRVKLAVGCVGPVPRRMRQVEEVLSGKDIDAARAAMERVRYAGEPVVAVVATSEREAEAALRLLDVDLDALPAVTRWFTFSPALAVDVPICMWEYFDHSPLSC